MTNYEMIKNMPVEEMAVTIMCPNETGIADIECDKSDDKNCCRCCLDWLNSEYEDKCPQCAYDEENLTLEENEKLMDNPELDPCETCVKFSNFKEVEE